MQGIKVWLVAFLGLVVGIAGADAQTQEAVTVRVTPQHPDVVPGERLVIGVELDHAPGFHTWPSLDQDVLPKEIAEFAYRTEITVAPSDPMMATVMPTQWPTPSPATVADVSGARPTVEAMTDQGRAIAYVPIVVAANAKGSVELNVHVAYQACDDKVCQIPVELDRVVTLPVVAAGAPRGPQADGKLFAAFDPKIWDRVAPQGGGGADPPGPVEPAVPPQQDSAAGSNGIPIDFIGYRFTVRPWMIMPIAFIVGIIMNLTPCVLPVIPIKVMSIQHHAKEPAKLRLFGMIYCLGIVAFFGVLAVLVGAFGQAWGQLNGYWWFSVPLALVVVLMGLSMFGLFTIRLPQSVYMLNPSGDTVGGNFMLGVLTAILSTPCTGPMLLAVLAWTATQPLAARIGAILLMGVGMAAPYALLSFFPKLVERVPRSGPGAELLKQVLGILMFSVAAYILSFLTSATWTWWFVGLFAAASFVWMYAGGLRVLKGINAKIVVTHAAILGLIVTALMTRAMTSEGAILPGSQAATTGGAIPWRVFKGPGDGDLSATIDAALADGRTVVVDFTAKWCANCHVIEKTILNSEEGREVLTRSDVIAIKVDITNSRYRQGLDVLGELSGAASIPFLAVMGPNSPRSRPETFASFFKPSDLTRAVRHAASPTSASR